MPALRTRDTHARSLEVTTDAPQPPTLAIISPTPRAFTFPSTHNLTDSPYSSPSSSPFEPDLRALAISNTPPPFPQRTLSPETAAVPAPISPSHKRRKSSCSSTDTLERRPKKGDEDYIKRPENAFILFRRKCCEDRQLALDDTSDSPVKKQRQADLSKTISQQWKGLAPAARQYWENLAKEKKKEHEQMYPNYVYRPQRAKDKDGRSKSRRPKGRRGADEYEHEFEEEPFQQDSVSFVVPMLAPRHHGRSASAPTPPPYQAIQIPNVYQMAPSCPTSPSLLPMISRRSSHPDHHDTGMSSSFDYMPTQDYMQPSFAAASSNFEASLQSSEFLRSMFAMSQNTHGFDLSPQQTQDTLLPSPASSIASSSSGPSSPITALSQADHDVQLQMEMQLQRDYASYSWDTNALWPHSSSSSNAIPPHGGEMLLGDDFDLGAIPPIELGLPKFSEDLGMGLGMGGMGFGMGDFGADFGVESYEYPQQQMHQHLQHGSEQGMDGLVGFDEMMAGAAAAGSQGGF